MVEPAGVADGDFAVGRHGVVAGAPRLLGVVVGLGFCTGCVDLVRCASASCPVGAVRVVVGGDFVELSL